MRRSLALLIVAAWAAIPIARSQTAAIQPAPAQTPAATLSPAKATQPSPHSSPRRSRSPRLTKTPKHRGAASGKPGGVLALGATDITGNKELPKVMVIVPWKDSLGAGAVVKPTDSLLDQMLQPVDRGEFQRQIHYYGQLDAGAHRPVPGKMAPAGDSR
ncbi:MAG: hypothetical protein KGL45_11990 [Gammaproteobacteria bacterium]|nr:hypothetical protein [Gammaproteobacteria bacterium]